jgi:HD-GYP domain-containing protein (c-di-GMP phosphodiesterase class II)
VDASARPAGRRATPDDQAPVRLAELVAALSLGIDLGFGQPMEHVLRQTLIALRLAELLGLDDEQRATVYYTALLVNVGCHTDAHEQAKWFGDDIALKADKYGPHGLRSVRAMASGMRRIGSGRPPLHRFRIGLDFLLSGHREVDRMIDHHAALARSLGAQLELPEDVLDALGATYEMWDGKGWPGDLGGEAIPIASRLAQLGEFLEVACRAGGVDAVCALVRARRGSQFDPRLCDLVEAEAATVVGGLDEVARWDAVIDAEPALAVTLDADEFDAALLAIANFVDLKSPSMLGHAQAVSELAARATVEQGEPGLARTMRRAGLVHDLGRLGISNAIWDKRGSLGPGEWERVRLHPYLTERMLRQSAALAPLGTVAVQHCERLDGSGYPQSLAGGAISHAARILGAADAYQAMREPRPHRAALSADDAAKELRADARAGRLDPQAVEAVLGAAGHRVTRRRDGPFGLTAREIDVLRLLARGLPNKEIATELVIAPKTVSNHVEHIYAKIGMRTRAGAALFALQHGLLPEERFAPPAPIA